MTEETARQLLSSLLAEKGIPVPETAHEDKEEATRLLLQRILSMEADGALPDAITLALIRTLDAAKETVAYDT